MDVKSGQAWTGRVVPARRERLRRWLRDDVTGRAHDVAVAIAVEGCTGWRYVVDEVVAAGFEAHLAEPADTQAARGRKRRAKTDRSDCRLLRELLQDGRLPDLSRDLIVGRSRQGDRRGVTPSRRPTSVISASTAAAATGVLVPNAPTPLAPSSPDSIRESSRDQMEVHVMETLALGELRHVLDLCAGRFVKRPEQRGSHRPSDTTSASVSSCNTRGHGDEGSGPASQPPRQDDNARLARIRRGRAALHS